MKCTDIGLLSEGPVGGNGKMTKI